MGQQSVPFSLEASSLILSLSVRLDSDARRALDPGHVYGEHEAQCEEEGLYEEDLVGGPLARVATLGEQRQEEGELRGA